MTTTFDAKKVFENLYLDVSGHVISSQARSKLNISSTAFVYGEILPDTFYSILEKVQPTSSDIFYDLGCGTGKAVMWAHLAFPFKKAVGVEFLEDLYEAARTVLKKYENEIKISAPIEKQNQSVDFVRGDFCEVNFKDADVIFTHSTCFSDETMAKLIKAFSCLKPGARVITVSKSIISPYFITVYSDKIQMGWGEGTIYIYARNNTPVHDE
jgi:SAM-dependent methyltransferase